MLPVRACVAFAVRCALRVTPVLTLLDQDGGKAAHRAITVAAEYAGGKEYSMEALPPHNFDFEVQVPYEHHQAARRAVGVVRWLMMTTFTARIARAYLSLGGRRTTDNESPCIMAAAAARAAVAVDQRNLQGVWHDLNVLKAAVERGEITARTPVPQSFFPANIDQPQIPPAADQPPTDG